MISYRSRYDEGRAQVTRSTDTFPNFTEQENLGRHDGRFTALEQVVEFYDSGVQVHPNLDPALRFGQSDARRLGLSAEEKAALVAFLHTLSDHEMVKDPKFSDPFVRR